MTEKLTKQLKDLLTNEKRGNLYDFVCNHFWEMNAEDLKNLCKEAFALLYQKAERENIANGEPYDYYSSLHREYYETLKENTSIFEE